MIGREFLAVSLRAARAAAQTTAANACKFLVQMQSPDRAPVYVNRDDSRLPE